MLVPLLAAWRSARWSPALPSEHFFIGEGYKEFWGKALFDGAHNHILHAMHEVPVWASWAPTIAMLAASLCAYVYYIAAPSLPAATARAFRPLYLFLLNKWYFDELYDFLFVRPAFWIGRCCGRAATARIIDGSGPTASRPRAVDAPAASSSCRPATSTTMPSPC